MSAKSNSTFDERSSTQMRIDNLRQFPSWNEKLHCAHTHIILLLPQKYNITMT